MIPVHIRWMIRRDMPEVMAIENRSFVRPLAEGDILTILRKRNAIGMVAELRDDIVGFMIYELEKKSFTIVDFAVHPNFRRNGIGEQMADTLIGKLNKERRTRVELSIRETNLDAQLFFRSQGFFATCVSRGQFGDTGEDGYCTEYNINAERASCGFSARAVRDLYQR